MTSANPRYDILFRPMALGPVTIKNRFYQVPHCNGLGSRLPRSHARMRGVKAEGGWGAVCTEGVSLDPTTDTTPFTQVRLWEAHDEPVLKMIADAIHEHGALAGAQLAHMGLAASNRYSREYPLAPSSAPTLRDPVHARAMDKQDIRNYRQSHRRAALRVKEAGFDLVYVYAADDLQLLQYFLSKRRNHRTDEYGGSLENRVRLLREVIQDTKDAVGDRCAVVVRLTIDELSGPDGIVADVEGRDIVAMLAELPDLWDVKLSGWAQDSQTSRFAKEGYQEPYYRFIKRVTTKPVVGTGRFTSPDAMLGQITNGLLDLVGAARPSIADPFLPRKIQEGRFGDIRECIGCNICVSSFNTGGTIICTQNPTIGEEYRRGWHPEHLRKIGVAEEVLIVGAGPAGLECAQALGKRGCRVTLAEATRELGGRVSRESKLPGLTEWARVRDWRVGQIAGMPNVAVYRESRLTAEDVLSFDQPHVVIATGSRWRRDGIGRHNHKAIPGAQGQNVFTPDDIMDGRVVPGPVVVFDDDDYYMGGVIAERLRTTGIDVTLVTPAALASAWTLFTLEQEKIQCRLIEIGVEIVCNKNLARIGSGAVGLTCVFTGRAGECAAASVVLVTARTPRDELYQELLRTDADKSQTKTITRIGDCIAPGTIAHAVFSGRRYAEELGEQMGGEVAFRTEPIVQ